MNQISEFYNGYQILLYPMEQTLRDPDVYSHHVYVLDQISRDIVFQHYFDTDNIFWSGVETQDKLMAYCKRVVDNIRYDE